MLKMKSVLLVSFIVAVSFLFIACGGGSSGGATDDGQNQGTQTGNGQLEGTYNGRYSGRWMGIFDTGELQFLIDSQGNITVKSHGHIGFGSAPSTPINPPEGDLDTLIENWATVDDQGVVTVIGLGSGETTTVTVASGIIQGSWNAPNGDYCIINVNEGSSPQNSPPFSQITSPSDGTAINYGATIVLTGNGTDIEDGQLSGASLVWTSDLDGLIGTGDTCTSNTLSVGTHHITLKVTDSQGVADTYTVAITVQAVGGTNAFAGTYNGRYEGNWMGIEDSGDVQIIIESNGNVTVKSQGHIGFGSAPGVPMNPREGDLNTLIENWATVDDQGDISVIGLGVGETAAVTAASGIIQGSWNAPNGDHCTFTANDGTNTAPVAQITSPSEGDTFNIGDMIQFSGSGSDSEDGALTGSSLVWTSDVDGQIGTGETFTSSTLSAGTHLITISVTDSQGAVATKAISITVFSGGSGTWTMVYGEEGDGEIYSVEQTSDGGFIFAGQITTTTGGMDIWLFKTDNEGNQIWSRTFGGTGSDWALSVQQTTDGAYVMAGSTTSSGSGGSDFLLIKTDSTGNEVWSRTFGGSGADDADSVIQTSDGGYIVAGGTYSFGAGGSDFWLIKTDSLGNETWNNTYDGIGNERAKSVQQTNDGGYILAGYAGSDGAPLDGFVVKTDASGKETWNKVFGTSDGDFLYSVIQANDGNYILAGQKGLNVDMSGDGWLIKVNSIGNVLWEKVYSLGDYDEVVSVQQATDGGYVLAGNTDANSDEAGWVIKTDGNGNVVWMNTYGSDNSHYALVDDIKITNDGGYILAGTQSNIATYERNGLAIKIDGSGNY